VRMLRSRRQCFTRDCVHPQTMFISEWHDGAWGKGELKPYGPLPMMPSAQVSVRARVHALPGKWWKACSWRQDGLLARILSRVRLGLCMVVWWWCCSP
jgi:hypothetical protein